MKAIKLRCNYLDEPMAVDTEQPSLSWQCESHLMHKYQSAYRILVSSRLELLTGNNPDIWDSGKIASGVSVNVTYEGKRLQGKTKYYWKVAVWDEKDTMSPWSDVANWRMGILDESAWLGQWITHKRYPKTKTETRKAFRLRCSESRSRWKTPQRAPMFPSAGWVIMSFLSTVKRPEILFWIPPPPAMIEGRYTKPMT